MNTPAGKEMENRLKFGEGVIPNWIGTVDKNKKVNNIDEVISFSLTSPPPKDETWKKE